MNQKFILLALIFSLVASVTLSPVFAEIEFDSGPLQEKPLDQREQEDQDTTDIWMYAIALVIAFIIIRVAFKIIKKRMIPKKDYRTGNPSKQSAHKSSCVVNPLGIFNPRFRQSETENFKANLPSSFLHL